MLKLETMLQMIKQLTVLFNVTGYKLILNTTDSYVYIFPIILLYCFRNSSQKNKTFEI